MTEIQRWLSRLAVAASVNLAPDDLEAKLTVYGELLPLQFNPEVFTSASLVHVAASCKGFPTFGELCELLSAWWRENKPRPPAIEGPAKPAPEPYAIPPAPEWLLGRRAAHRPMEEGADRERDLMPISEASVLRQLNALGYASRADVPKLALREPRPLHPLPAAAA